jgi:hypothetical protein
LKGNEPFDGYGFGFDKQTLFFKKIIKITAQLFLIHKSTPKVARRFLARFKSLAGVFSDF